MQDIKEVVKFNSVEEFWGLYNNIIGPSLLGARADYYLFKDDIIPAWEDPANKHGGKWSVQFPRDKTRNQIDAMWLNTVSKRFDHFGLMGLSCLMLSTLRCERCD